MFKILGKKKLTEDKLTNVFVNSVIQVTESGFPEIASLINEGREFEKPPNISGENSDRFLLIVVAGNLKFISKHFESGQDTRIKSAIIKKFARVFGLGSEEFSRIIDNYHQFFARINHPSKNTLYAMSKAMFYKYELNEFQVDYFRKVNAPNPLFLKKMDEIMQNFLWDWESYKEKFSIVKG